MVARCSLFHSRSSTVAATASGVGSASRQLVPSSSSPSTRSETRSTTAQRQAIISKGTKEGLVVEKTRPTSQLANSFASSHGLSSPALVYENGGGGTVSAP